MNETAEIKPKPNKHRQQQTRWLEKGNSCFRSRSGWSRLCLSPRWDRVPGHSGGVRWPHVLLAPVHPSCTADGRGLPGLFDLPFPVERLLSWQLFSLPRKQTNKKKEGRKSYNHSADNPSIFTGFRWDGLEIKACCHLQSLIPRSDKTLLLVCISHPLFSL